MNIDNLRKDLIEEGYDKIVLYYIFEDIWDRLAKVITKSRPCQVPDKTRYDLSECLLMDGGTVVTSIFVGGEGNETGNTENYTIELRVYKNR
jgi:hypothetical protein